MKTKMIYSDYDKNSGMSTVTVANAYGQFTGFAICHPEEEPSRFFGCTLAEYRATIKALKEEKKIYKYQIKALKETYDMFCDNKNFNKNSLEARKIRKSIAMKQTAIKEICNIIKGLQTTIDEAPKKRFEVIKLIKDRTH